MLTRTRNAGGDLYLAHVSDKVNQLFIMTKLVNVFNIKSSVNEALAALKAAETEN
jgi:anti-anti-sigma regulatory factor